MDQVNALKVRNNLGAILDRLNATGEPILISKGRKIRAVLITPEQYEKRFLDFQAKKEKQRLLNTIHSLKGKKKEAITSINVLRRLRGYPE